MTGVVFVYARNAKGRPMVFEHLTSASWLLTAGITDGRVIVEGHQIDSLKHMPPDGQERLIELLRNSVAQRYSTAPEKATFKEVLGG